jgi:hypothetical protein
LSPTNSDGIFYGELSTIGTFENRDEAVLFGSGSSWTHEPYDIEYLPTPGQPSDGVYGVAWYKGGIGGMDAMFSELTSDGTLIRSEDVASGGGNQRNSSIAARGDAGEVVMVYRMHYISDSDATGTLFGGLFTAGSETAMETAANPGDSELTDAGANDDVAIATNGNQSAIVFYNADEERVELVFMNAALELSDPVTMGQNSYTADIAETPSGFAVAWTRPDSFQLELITTSGTTICGPTTVDFGDDTKSFQDGVAVMHTPYGTLVLAVDTGGDIGLYRFNDSCQVIDELEVDASASAPTHPRMALGGGHVVLSWTDGDQGYVRVVGDMLCN